MDDRQHRRAMAHWKLIAAGWSPPPPNDEQAQRILDDIQDVDNRRGGWHKPPTLQLTEREQIVLRLAAAGYTRKEIAELSGVTMETVKTQQERARLKLGARNITNAVWLAEQQGLLEAA